MPSPDPAPGCSRRGSKPRPRTPAANRQATSGQRSRRIAEHPPVTIRDRMNNTSAYRRL